ncbi:heterodisulfide reductase subunit A [Desulfacinum hydrothermale DSM 13146]|uniref:Heterodisulfide reductase subunit A n=1 Tax=Desulfacinum hydrothermale DSM 13146 TaxID=1121390 RepID=A0A1W1X9S4_9BACT|nr:FAD-dependent oxidoreductase [Desulfacinum hydrothermale]SMC20570.1 heterodisulfide reductase subunit A [Desulfacinum hydrothermale DSM 13146]
MGEGLNRTDLPSAGAHQRIVVVGGGVAGIHAALQAADLGHPVVLVERDLALGGHMAQLDKTYPTLDCSMCILSPRLYAINRHPLITLLVRSRVDVVTGCAGSFRVGITQRPGYVDPNRCIGCGTCHRKCPVKVPDPFNVHLGTTKAIRALYPQAVPSVHAIDPDHCLHFTHGVCQKCVKACPAQAIDFDQKPRFLELEAGAVILAGGFDLLDRHSLATPQWLELPQVITNVALERYLSSTGPTRGILDLPGLDGPPRHIAFVQCAGSRDPVHGVPYCSSYCCSATLKHAAILAGMPHVESVTICAMDIRAHGRECEPFFRRVQALDKVRIVRGKVGEIVPLRDSGGLQLQGSDGARPWTAKADLVVLAMGMRPSAEAQETADRLGLPRDSLGFAAIKAHHSVSTPRDGVYVCGTIKGPESIPTTVQEACAAAIVASKRLRFNGLPVSRHDHGPSLQPQAQGREGAERAASRTPEQGGGHQEIRIGVFICRCGTNIAGVLDTASLAQWAARLPRVAHAEENLFSCSTDVTRRMAETAIQKRLNRLVVASCSPRTHLGVFQAVLAKTGLPPGYVRMANIREQCAWVHKERPQEAFRKAQALIEGVVAQVTASQAAPVQHLPIAKSAVVFGSSVAALTAAIHVADAGHECLIVEAEEQLGGRLRHALCCRPELNLDRLYRYFLGRVRTHPRIQVFTRARLLSCTGSLGRFDLTWEVQSPDPESGRRRLHHRAGVVLIAVGAQPLKPQGLFGYGTHPAVVTQAELADQLARGDLDLGRSGRVAMIQCVGSRNDERPYCSRSCCQQAVSHALEIKERHPHVHISILYRDVRTYGTAELLYEEARKRGIQFLRYEEDHPPQVAATRFGRRSTLDIRWRDPGSGRRLHDRVDLLVLSSATVPSPENRTLSALLRVPLTRDGFFLEKHVKLAPVETSVEGIFIAGQCHSPKTIPEAMVQGDAAAAKMLAVLRAGELERPAFVAAIDPSRCSRCLSCVAVCQARAIEVRGLGPPRVDPGVCQGCGVCAAECPAGAIDVAGAEDKALRAGLTAMLSCGSF